MDKVTVYCDGSCLGNPGPGGYAALLQIVKEGKEYEKVVSGGLKETTNNRAELMAAISAIKALKRPCDIKIVTDSNYVIKGITEWIINWKKKGWVNSAKKPVVNKDLWEELDQEVSRHTIKWQWVKGHSGHPENERVDKLAYAEAQKISKQ